MSICDYLDAPTGEVLIQNNATGCNDSTEVIERCTEAVDELSPFENLTISPNPTTGTLTLQYSISDTHVIPSGVEGRDLKLEVFSLNGFRIKTFSIGKQQPGIHEIQLDLSKLPDGMYFLRMQAGEMAEIIKIVIQK
jgi:hypothetical protein